MNLTVLWVDTITMMWKRRSNLEISILTVHGKVKTKGSAHKCYNSH